MADIHDPNYSRRRFLQAAGASLAAAPLLGAVSPAAAQVPDIRLPDVPGQKVGWAIVGIGGLTANQILPAFPKCQKSKVVSFVSGRPEKAARFAQVHGVDAEEHLQLRELRQDRRQPGHPGGLHRAAQQHARRVHDPRAQGRQARAVREADGQHRGRLRKDDRGGQGGQQEADGGVSLPLRAEQPARDPDGRRTPAKGLLRPPRPDSRRRWGWARPA